MESSLPSGRAERKSTLPYVKKYAYQKKNEYEGM